MSRTESEQKQLELNSLIEFSQTLNGNLDLDFIFRNILLSIMGKMLISKALVLIKKDFTNGTEVYLPITSRGIDLKSIPKEMELVFPKIPFFHADELETCHKLKDYDLKYFFKIYFQNKLLGVLCIGNKLGAGTTELSKSEIVFIETMLNISASAIENTLKFTEIKALNQNLNSKIQQLKSLFELSKEFNSNILNKENILKLLNFSLLGNFGIRDYAIISKDKEDKLYLMKENKNVNLEDFDVEILNTMNKPYMIREENDNEFLDSLYKKHYELIIPTVNDGKTDNIIILGKKLTPKPYSESDLEFLESIVNLSVMSIENSMLFDEFLDKKKIESELRIAREIQIALLPKNIPQVKDYDITATNIPALHIGGDYFDVIKLNENKVALIIADVSGKGTPASLLMSNIQSAVHSYLKLYAEDTFDLESVTGKINELIYENTPPEKFITFFWGILDTNTHEFEYINAGHNPPFVLKNSHVDLLDKGGFMIGIMDTGVIYEKGKITLGDDDVLIFYTDGVTEAQNNLNEEYGDENLISFVKNIRGETSKTILTEITNSIDTFTKGMPQYDDITLIILKKNKCTK
ncbi:MAG: PP2C family protein-serine/threonine phosphatase [Bacteroidetes bacterium]|nr:PP2C family protein-serine/threonine phosphatase [Bacteroidota bacterium]